MRPLKLSEKQFRALGILPFVFFVGQAVHYWRINEIGHMLWMCNIGNLILAIGLFINHAMLIRVAVIWMFPGLVIWVIYVLLPWGLFLSSIAAHLGGLAVGLIALQRIGMDRLSWVYALLWFLVVQLLSRLFTPIQLNVNLSQAIEPGWRNAFGSYWKFWGVGIAITAVILWAVCFALQKLWPAPSQSR